MLRCSSVKDRSFLTFADADIPKQAKVKEYWTHGAWSLPHPIDFETAATLEEVRNHSVHAKREDIITWKLSSSSQYTIESA